MSEGAARKILRIAGDLIINPTDISDSAKAPYGGTFLGVTKTAEFRMNITTALVTAEEWGQAPVESLFTGESAVFAFVLRELDNDALGTVFPNTSTGTTSGDKVIEGAVDGVGVNRAGYLLSNKSVSLLFAPQVQKTTTTPGSSTYLPYDEQPMIYLRKTIPMVEETSMFQLSLAQEIGIGVVFQSIPDSNGKLYEIGKRGDLTL
jgi:hypothetical protein